MTAYKAFTINAAGDPKPWGAREEQAIKDIIDTLVVGTVDGTKQTAGHRHYSLRHPTNGYDVLAAGPDQITIWGKGQGSSTGLNITQADFFTADWVDWTPYCELSGFSGTPTKQIRYRRVGKLVFIEVLFSGVNNNPLIAFVVPFPLERMVLSATVPPVLGCLWASIGGGIDNCAARAAKDYRGGGLSDWFLPSKDELAELYTQRAVLGNFKTPGQVYWSSSEIDAMQAWMLWDNGTMKSDATKNFFGFVRPIRMGTHSPAYNVGDTGPGGGKIFWVSGGDTYLEAAADDVSDERVTWVSAAMQSTEVGGLQGTAIGTGYQNTDEIVTQEATEALPAFVVLQGALVLKISRGDGAYWAGDNNLSLRGTFFYLMD